MYICGYEISEWKACKAERNGSEFYKKRNYNSSLGVRIARLSLLENSNKMYKNVFNIFIVCFAI